MEIHSFQLILGLFLLATIVCGTIIGLRMMMRSRAKHIHRSGPSNDMGADSGTRTKYVFADSFRFSGGLKLLGVAIALAFSLLMVSWTQYEMPLYAPDNSPALVEVIDIVPVTFSPLTPPPPPQESRYVEVPKETIPEETQPVFVDTIVEVINPMRDSVVMPGPVVEPPQLRQGEDDVPEIFVIVEQMPRFPGCEDMQGTYDEKFTCSVEKFLAYVFRHLKYPALARENNIEGSVVVDFIVEPDGKVSNAQILKDIGGGCGDEVLRVVNSMNGMPDGWTPGKQRGEAVRVKFKLPVIFRLSK